MLIIFLFLCFSQVVSYLVIALDTSNTDGCSSGLSPIGSELSNCIL